MRRREKHGAEGEQEQQNSEVKQDCRRFVRWPMSHALFLGRNGISVPLAEK
jgi:hypothetical protein